MSSNFEWQYRNVLETIPSTYFIPANKKQASSENDSTIDDDVEEGKTEVEQKNNIYSGRRLR
jgi:hypothetical protein